MLGKLLKHEWKAVWKVPTLLIGILLLLAFASGLTFALPIWDSEWIGLPLSGIMLILLFYVTMIGVSLGITIYFAVRYYRNMYTDEGYLMHTLPVTPRQLLGSKIITMSSWNLIGVIAEIVSFIVFGSVAFTTLAAREGRFAADVLEGIAELRDIWSTPFFEGFGAFCVAIVCMLLTSAVSGTMMVIGAITLGQMVRGHRVLGAIGAYFAINAVFSVINMVVMLPFMVQVVANDKFLSNFEQSPFAFYTVTYASMAVVSVLVSVGLYFLCEYLLRRQLELE